MLSENLKTLLGTTFAFYVKIHGFHFNIEGKNFPQYHKFLGKFYDDVYGSVDKIGEYIRTLDQYSPGSLTRFMELSIIQDQLKVPRAELMMAELYEDNTKLLTLLKSIFKVAEQEDEQGIANFIAERIDAQAKWGWQLRSILKVERD